MPTPKQNREMLLVLKRKGIMSRSCPKRGHVELFVGNTWVEVRWDRLHEYAS